MRKGHKQNSILNGEWAAHVRRSWKKLTSGKRRIKDKEIIKEELDEIDLLYSEKPILLYDYRYGYNPLTEIDKEIILSFIGEIGNIDSIEENCGTLWINSGEDTYYVTINKCESE